MRRGDSRRATRGMRVGKAEAAATFSASRSEMSPSNGGGRATSLRWLSAGPRRFADRRGARPRPSATPRRELAAVAPCAALPWRAFAELACTEHTRHTPCARAPFALLASEARAFTLDVRRPRGACLRVSATAGGGSAALMCASPVCAAAADHPNKANASTFELNSTHLYTYASACIAAELHNARWSACGSRPPRASGRAQFSAWQFADAPDALSVQSTACNGFADVVCSGPEWEQPPAGVAMLRRLKARLSRRASATLG